MTTGALRYGLYLPPFGPFGDPAVLASSAIEFPNGRLVSRSIDNRIGAFVVLENAGLVFGRDPDVLILHSEAGGLFDVDRADRDRSPAFVTDRVR